MAAMTRRLLLVAFLGLIAALSFHLSSPLEEPGQRSERPKQSDKLSNIVLYTQHGKAVRFYDDLVKDRTVLINLMYIGCGDICPANSAALASLHELLGKRVGRDILMLSISIDPIGDTPERLKRYWEPDSEIDADPTQHSGVLTVGNDRTNRWLSLPVLMHAGELASTILRVAGPL